MIYKMIFIALLLSISPSTASGISLEEPPLEKRYVRQLESIFRKITESLNQETSLSKTEPQYQFTSLSQGWVLEIKNLSTLQKMRIHGYTFPLNEASTADICADKPACFDVLSSTRIPCVQHQLFSRPTLENYVKDAGVFDSLHAYTKQNPYPWVIKRKDGTGGTDVFKVNNARELEIQAIQLFSKGHDICIAPYYTIVNEYRVIVLDDTPKIVFNKIRPFLKGDGHSTLQELFAHEEGQKKVHKNLQYFFNTPEFRDNKILEKDEIVYLNWKHNLAQGSTPHILSHRPDIEDLALKAARCLGLRFGSVDIIETDKREFLILEINSGVMMEKFSKHSAEYYERAFALYKEAVQSYFNIK